MVKVFLFVIEVFSSLSNNLDLFVGVMDEYFVYDWKVS